MTVTVEYAIVHFNIPMQGIQIKCNLCGTDDSKLLFIKDSYQVVECNQCGLSYINPRPLEDTLKEKYGGDYSLGYIAKKTSKRKRAKKIVGRIIKIKKEGRFLDIGCSAGFILEAARENGFETYGVDISPHGLRHAREALQLNVVGGFLQDIHFPNGFFDVIVMYDVIEHLPDPTKTLREINRIIKSDGLIEIWTPNMGHRRAKRMGKEWPHIISDHLYYFSLETLGKMLEKVGLYIFKKQFTLKDTLKIYIKKRPENLGHHE